MPTRTRQPRRASSDHVLEFMRLLWAIDHELQRLSKRMRRTLGVTGPQRLAIRTIERLPDGPAQEVARALHLHKSTITGILQRLEQQGFVSRTTDPGDARRIQLRLTAKGRRITAAKGATIEQAVRRGLARASREKLAAARDVLKEVAAALEKSAHGSGE
jgi:DNA-binding MarR family transcriptional regulator